MQKTGIVILNYNSGKDTLRLVKNLRKEGVNFPIVIVDNNSPNGDYYFLKENLKNEKDVFILNSEKNLGYAKGNNLGIKYLINNFNINYVFIMNPDISIKKDTIFEMLKIIKQNGNIALVAPKMLSGNKESLSAWKLPTFKDDLILSLKILTKIFGNPLKYNEELYISKKPKEVDVVQGACFLAKVKALKDVDFFDERTFLFCEERILAYKLKSKGYKIIFLPYVNFSHKIAGSIRKTFKRIKRYLILQKSRRIYQKYYLKQNIVKLFLFDFVTFLGIIENLLISFFLYIKTFLGKNNE